MRAKETKELAPGQIMTSYWPEWMRWYSAWDHERTNPWVKLEPGSPIITRVLRGSEAEAADSEEDIVV
jgi:hypothetical protein